MQISPLMWCLHATSCHNDVSTRLTSSHVKCPDFWFASFRWNGKHGKHGSQESPGSFVSKFEELELTSIFQYLDVYTLINYKERIFCSSELASVLPKINTLGCSNPIKDSPWNLELSGTLFTPNIQNLSNGAMFGPWPKGLEIPKKQMKLSISNMLHL